MVVVEGDVAKVLARLLRPHAVADDVLPRPRYLDHVGVNVYDQGPGAYRQVLNVWVETRQNLPETVLHDSFFLRRPQGVPEP